MYEGGKPTIMLRRVYAVICEWEERLARFLLTATLAVVLFAAFTRYIGHPIAWGMEFATFLFAWAVFLAADAALRHDRHPSVDLFVNLLPKKVRLGIKLLNYALILIFLVVLAYHGSILTWTTRFRTYSGIPGFSYAWPTLSVPVGCLLLSITTILKARETWQAFRGAGNGEAQGEGVDKA